MFTVLVHPPPPNPHPIPYPPSIIYTYFWGKCEEEKTIKTSLVHSLNNSDSLKTGSSSVFLHMWLVSDVLIAALPTLRLEPIFIWQAKSFPTDVWSTLQIHNHPSSLSPSWTDVKCLCNTLPSLAPWNTAGNLLYFCLLPGLWILRPNVHQYSGAGSGHDGQH